MGALANEYILVRADMSKVAGDVRKGGIDAGKNFSGSFSGTAKKAIKGGLIATGLAAGAAFGGALKKGFGRLSAIENATAKLDGLGHSAKSVDKIMANALASVKGTAFGLDEAATVAATAVAAGIKPGRELQKTLGLVADAATIGGTSLNEMGAIFNKVAASNKIQGDTINQLNERGIPILKLLGDVMGKSQGEVSKLASAGKVDFATFQKAMEKGLGGAALKSGNTASGAFKNMGAAFSRVGAALLKGVFPQIGAGFNVITRALDAITPAAARFGEIFGNAVRTAGLSVSAFFAAFREGDVTSDGVVGFFERMGVALKGVADRVRNAMQILRTALSEGTTVGSDQGGLLSALTKGLVAARPLIQWLQSSGVPAIKALWAALSQGTTVGSDQGQGLSTLTKAIVAARTAIMPLINFIRANALPALRALGEFVRDTILPAWVDWQKNMASQLLPIIRQLGGFFVASVLPAFKAVAGFVTSTLVPGLLSIVGALKGLVSVVGPIVAQIVGAILGKFNQMRPQIMSIWTSVKEIIVGVMFIIREVITSVTNIIRMVWDRWGTQITAVVTTVFRGLVTIISGVMKTIAGIIKLVVALIKGDWSGAWNAIKQIFAGVWQAIKGILIAATAVLRATLAAWWAKVKSLWTAAQTAVKTTWNTFWTNVKTTAATAIDAVRTKISTVLDKIKAAFQTAKDNIKRIWDGVKDVVSKPVVWIKDNVYNKPLVPVWNRVAALVSGPKLSAYASGGVEGVRPGYTPGRDTHPIMVSGGEAIMRPEWTRVVGKDWIDQANAAARRGVGAARNFIGDPKGMPGFAGGGVWSKSVIGSATSKVGNLKDWALGNLREVAGKVLDPVKRLIDTVMPKSGVGTTVGGIGKKAIDLVLDKIKTEDAAAMPAVGGPAGSAIASGGWASIYRILRAVGARSFTTYPTHDQGPSRSRDIWPASAGDRVAETARRISSIWYVIWKRRIASITTARRWIPYFGSNPHTDHVHVTLKPNVRAAKGGIANFDNGGVFKPGLNLAYNGTGRDELLRPVRNGRVSSGGSGELELSERTIRRIGEVMGQTVLAGIGQAQHVTTQSIGLYSRGG